MLPFHWLQIFSVFGTVTSLCLTVRGGKHFHLVYTISMCIHTQDMYTNQGTIGCVFKQMGTCALATTMYLFTAATHDNHIYNTLIQTVYIYTHIQAL